MSRETKGSIFFLLKTLVLSYVATAGILFLLAFLLYKLRLSARVVSIAIILSYVLVTAFAGFLTGKHMKNRKFLWGLLVGGLYFAVLAAASVLLGHGAESIGTSFVTTMVLCAAGGMLGGMLA